MYVYASICQYLQVYASIFRQISICMYVHVFEQFLSDRYGMSTTLRLEGISERHQYRFYCSFIHGLWPGYQQAKLWPRS